MSGRTSEDRKDVEDLIENKIEELEDHDPDSEASDEWTESVNGQIRAQYWNNTMTFECFKPPEHAFTGEKQVQQLELEVKQ